MRALFKTGLVLAVVSLSVTGIALAERKDKPGSKDHSMFTRMPNFFDLKDRNLPVMENIRCIPKWAGLEVTCWRKLCSLLNFLNQKIVH